MICVPTSDGSIDSSRALDWLPVCWLAHFTYIRTSSYSTLFSYPPTLHCAIIHILTRLSPPLLPTIESDSNRTLALVLAPPPASPHAVNIHPSSSLSSFALASLCPRFTPLQGKVMRNMFTMFQSSRMNGEIPALYNSWSLDMVARG